MTDAKAGPPGECNFQPFSGPSLSIPCLAHVGSMATAILFSRNEVGQTEPSAPGPTSGPHHDRRLHHDPIMVGFILDELMCWAIAGESLNR